MDTLLAIFVRVIVPVMITVGVGYLAARLLVFDLKMLARLGLYVLRERRLGPRSLAAAATTI